MDTYEEKYKDLVKRLNKAREDVGGYTFNSVLDAVAPELKESEGEKIRKEIISALKYANHKGVYDKHLAWLEKQGEQPKKHDVCDNCDQQGSCVSPCPMKLVEKQGEHKSVNDLSPQEAMDIAVAKCFEQGEQKPIDPDTLIQQRVNALADIIAEQKPAWSKEDEEKMVSIFLGIETFCPSIIYGNDKEELLNWFKDLKERVGCEVNCTTTWKPSDEQMDAVKDAIDYLGCNTKKVREYLMSLYEQLKKLREE